MDKKNVQNPDSTKHFWENSTRLCIKRAEGFKENGGGLGWDGRLAKAAEVIARAVDDGDG